MQIAILVTAYNRHDFLIRTITALSKCRGVEDTQQFFFVDHSDRQNEIVSAINKAQKERASTTTQKYSVIAHATHQGPSKNILEALRDLFDNRGFHFVFCLDDDLLPSADWIEMFQYCYRNFSIAANYIGIAGYSNNAEELENNMAMENKLSPVTWFNWIGCALSRNDWTIIKEHVTEKYYSDMWGYTTVLWKRVMATDPDFTKKTNHKGKYCFPEHDGLINIIRALHGKKQLIPIQSRIRHIGYFGSNQKQKRQDGTDPNDSKNWKTAISYNDCWKEDHKWTKLEIL